jgi:tRNA modification GTPase
LSERLGELRAYVEAAIDFAEEEIECWPPGAQPRDLQARSMSSHALRRPPVGQGRLLTEGITIVIAGRPNAGKSRCSIGSPATMPRS